MYLAIANVIVMEFLGKERHTKDKHASLMNNSGVMVALCRGTPCRECSENNITKL